MIVVLIFHENSNYQPSQQKQYHLNAVNFSRKNAKLLPWARYLYVQYNNTKAPVSYIGSSNILGAVHSFIFIYIFYNFTLKYI